MMNKTEVSFFENIKSVKNGKKIPIAQLLADIKNGMWKREAARIRGIEDDNERREEKSKILPCATISGIFSERKNAKLKKHSGHICIDMDDLDNAENARENLKADPYTYALFTSASGRGRLAVIVRIDPEKHLESFLGLEKYYLNNYSYKIDESCKDVSRARFVSYDPDLFINPESEVFKNYITKKTDNPKSNTKSKEETITEVEYVVQQVLDKKIILGNDSYGDWLKLGFALADGLGEDGRDYFHKVSSVSDKYNPDDCDKQYDSCLNGNKPEGKITIATFFDYAIKADIRIDKIVENASVTFSEEALIHQDSDLIPETPFPLEIFPGKLSAFIHRLAESLHVPVNLSACCTLPIIGSAVGNTLRISPKPGWSEPPFIWLVPIAFSGDGKSPVINKLMEPLNKLQLDAYEKYSEELTIYEKALRRARKEQDIDVPDKPKLKHYKVTDFTTEVLVDIFHDDPHGILIYRDELSGLFLGLNQYKGGKGNDRQQLLELFNCAPMKVDRKNKVTCTARSGASIIGGLQPRVMLEIFREASFDDGLAPRFLFVHINTMRKRFSRTSITDADFECWRQLLNWCYGLQGYYGGSQQPAILQLNSDALDVFESFYNSYEDLTPFLSPKAKVFIPKLITYSLRLAGVLHSIQAYPYIDKFNKPVSAETITNAIKLTQFFAGQMVKGLKLYEKKAPEFDEHQKRLVDKLRKLQFTVSHGKIKLEHIVTEFNNNIPKALQHTPESMTKLLITLGLKTKKSTSNRSYLLWEQEKLVKIFSRIPVTTVPTVTQRSVEPVKQGTEGTDVTVDSKKNNLPEVEI